MARKRFLWRGVLVGLGDGFWVHTISEKKAVVSFLRAPFSITQCGWLGVIIFPNSIHCQEEEENQFSNEQRQLKGHWMGAQPHVVPFTLYSVRTVRPGVMQAQSVCWLGEVVWRSLRFISDYAKIKAIGILEIMTYFSHHQQLLLQNSLKRFKSQYKRLTNITGILYNVLVDPGDSA